MAEHGGDYADGEDDHGDEDEIAREDVRVDEGGQFVDEGGYDEEHARRDPGNPLWDESLIVLLLVGGAVLFLVPEPSTSAIGAVAIAVGVLAWLVDAIG